MNTTRILPELPSGAKILFIRLRSLDDTVLSTPLYAALKEWRPDLQLSILVEEPNDEVLAGNLHVCRVFSLPVHSLHRLPLLAQRYAVLRRLRKERFHCCINL